MKWFCFMFWFVWRLAMACLAHFNWILSIYTNCAYFTLWKSYDLLWFWMHIMLCVCFSPLRKENYLIVWTNLIRHRFTKYRAYSFKEIYLRLYGGKGTKAERELEVMEEVEVKERNERLSRRQTRKAKKSIGEEVSSDSSDDDTIVAASTLETSQRKPNEKAIIRRIAEEEDEKERDRYLYVGNAVDSSRDLPLSFIESPSDARISMKDLPDVEQVTLREEREDSEAESKSGDESDTNSTSKWLQNVPDVIKNNAKEGEMPDIPVPRSEQMSDTTSTGKWNRFKSWLPNVRLNRSVSEVDPVALDVLTKGFCNTFDVADEKMAKKREKTDMKNLTKKLRLRRKMELKEAAAIEKRRKKITDAIELLLQLLRMMTSFAILIGNIRKTFIPAQFKYLRPGQRASDNPELLMFFRFTCFMDVSMFWLNALWAWCLQWQLCCRLGLFRFLFWSSLLGLLSFTVMLLPMSIAMDQLDLSWCHFAPNTTLYPYQPKW